MFESPFALMAIFAAVVSVMTGFLKCEGKRDIVRLAAKMFAIMVVGGVLLSWFMALV
jgi:hypothetical protein